MFKKIEIWILYLCIILSIVLIISFGFLVRQELVGKKKFGKVSELALEIAELPAVLKRVLKGQTVEDRFSSQDGFNGNHNFQETFLLLSAYDKTEKKPTVKLIDLTTFKVVHKWSIDFKKLNKLVGSKEEFKIFKKNMGNNRTRMLHPMLIQNGSLAFIENGAPFRIIDVCSNLILQNTENLFHHSIEKDSEGNFWVPSWLNPKSLPSNIVGNKLGEKGFYDNAITKLSPKGKILFEKSLTQIFIENDMEYLLFSVGDREFTTDPIHLNDIQPVNFDGPYWKKGDVFLSLRHQSMVLLYRPSTNKIIWKLVGKFFHQHDVNVLNESQISIFNNNSKDFINGDIVDGNNEVLIYDFKDKKYTSYLKKSLVEKDVRTVLAGRGLILQNKDLFIEETYFGRLLYFNSNGSLRWSFVSRDFDGNVHRLGWSRLIDRDEELELVQDLIRMEKDCK